MIPTCYKSKLPKLLSYPIGAAALTAGLAGAPHLDSFSVSFSWIPSTSWQSTVLEKHPCTILIARYEPAQKPGYRAMNSMIEGGYYDEKWELTIRPVLRELRHAANCLLREQGLAWVVDWLRSAEQPDWLGQHQEIELTFNPIEKSITKRTNSGVVRYTK